MADNFPEQSESELKKKFKEAWKLFREIEKNESPSNSPVFQDKIGSCIKLFSDATRMVNILSLFSRNEELSEMSTAIFRYLLLPVFLGELNLLRISDDRHEDISRAKVYFIDFLERCQDYSVTKKDLSEYIKNSSDGSKKSYEKSIEDRQTKIDRYKETKELKSKIDELEKRVDHTTNIADDEVEREYYLSWIRFWINESIEKLGHIRSELEILEHMKKLKSGQVKATEQPKTREPIKPILITKDSLKSKVFGAGYPSLPSITPEQWMDQQIADGKVVLDYNPNVNTAPAEKDSSDDEEESEEKLKKEREWDEWKDDHRRGEGNRINRG